MINSPKRRSCIVVSSSLAIRRLSTAKVGIISIIFLFSFPFAARKKSHQNNKTVSFRSRFVADAIENLSLHLDRHEASLFLGSNLLAIPGKLLDILVNQRRTTTSWI